MTTRIPLLCLLTVLFSTFCLAYEVKEFTPDQSVTYKKIKEVELKIHIFYPPDHKVSDKRPAVVFFFGGGWVSGSPSQFYPHCDYLASLGMVALSAEYRVGSRHGTQPAECVKDGKSAIRWIREQSDLLGVDPNRVAAGGGSAGGQVAAATGTIKGFEEPGENLAVSSVPNALLLFNPVFDNGPDGWGYDRVKAYWKEFSPLHNINGNTPPTVVFLGTNDSLIPVATAEKYQAKMRQLNLRCDLYLYKDQKHGFFNYGNRDYYLKTIAEARTFLASLDYIDADEESGQSPIGQ